MKDLIQQLPDWLRSGMAVKGLITLAVGFFVAKALAKMTGKAAAKRSEKHTAMMIGKVVYYAVLEHGIRPAFPRREIIGKSWGVGGLGSCPGILAVRCQPQF